MARTDKFERILNRRVPYEKRATHLSRRVLAEATSDYRYLVNAMQPIDIEYTENTFREGNRVKDQLESYFRGTSPVNFEYQGSVTSDTHIQTHSDIDLLVLCDLFFSVDKGVTPENPYDGNPNEDLKKLRDSCSSVLGQKFPEATVNAKPGKSIEVDGGSLRRKIDVVIGNWWNTNAYNDSKSKRDRGIRILDSSTGERIWNKPFLHNFLIDVKDERTNGLRKAIRLLKSLKYDASNSLKISSYDICALAYGIDDELLCVTEGDYLQLAKNTREGLRYFIENAAARSVLKVPNDMRYVFCDEGTDFANLKLLVDELDELLAGIARVQENTVILNRLERKTASLDPAWIEQRAPSVIANTY